MAFLAFFLENRRDIFREGDVGFASDEARGVHCCGENAEGCEEDYFFHSQEVIRNRKRDVYGTLLLMLVAEAAR